MAARRDLLSAVPEDKHPYFLFVGADTFTSVLRRSVDQFTAAVGSSLYEVVSLSSTKSDSWILGRLLTESLRFQPDGEVGIGQVVKENPKSVAKSKKAKSQIPLTQFEQKFNARRSVAQAEAKKSIVSKLWPFAHTRFDHRVESAFLKLEPELVIVGGAAYSGRQLFGVSWPGVIGKRPKMLPSASYRP